MLLEEFIADEFLAVAIPADETFVRFDTRVFDLYTDASRSWLGRVIGVAGFVFAGAGDVECGVVGRPQDASQERVGTPGVADVLDVQSLVLAEEAVDLNTAFACVRGPRWCDGGSL